MSRLSIYETSWIDLVFENRNKEYGAYQLRRESAKTSLSSLFMGLLFVSSLTGISMIASYFNPIVGPVITIQDFTETVIKLTDIVTPKTEKTVIPQLRTKTTEATIPNDHLKNPVIVHPNEASPNVATNIENTNTTTSDKTGSIDVINPIPSGTGTNIDKTTDIGTGIVTTIALDKLPEFPGGMDKFYSYVGNNFEKPEIDGERAIRIFVSFVIEKDGSMTDIRVQRDPGYGLGKEAIRVLKSLRTKWSPGMIGSKPVRTSYNLPIVIEMQ